MLISVCMYNVCMVHNITRYILLCADKKTLLTLSSKIVEESDFSDTAYNNSAYVGDVRGLIARINSQQFWLFFDTRKMLGEIWNIQKNIFEYRLSFCLGTAEYTCTQYGCLDILIFSLQAILFYMFFFNILISSRNVTDDKSN